MKDAKTVAEAIAMEHITAWQYAHDDSKAIAAPKRFFQIVQSIYQTLSTRDAEIAKLNEQLKIAREALEDEQTCYCGFTTTCGRCEALAKMGENV